MSAVLAPSRPAAVPLAPAGPDRRVVRRRLGPGRRVPFATLLGPVLLLALWSLGSATGWIDERTLTAPWTVVQTTGTLLEDGRLVDNLLVSATRAGLGLGLGIVAGVVLAVVAGLSRLGEAVVDGPVQVKRSIPSLALIPLLILWFGIGEEMKVLTIALGVVVPVYIHTHNGLRSIDHRYAELAETVGLSRARFVRSVVVPGAMPGFLLGLRFATTTALLSLVVVEQVNSTGGIGYMVTLAANYGQTDVIVVGLVVYAVLGLVADGAVRTLERKALTWRRTLDA